MTDIETPNYIAVKLQMGEGIYGIVTEMTVRKQVIVAWSDSSGYNYESQYPLELFENIILPKWRIG